MKEKERRANAFGTSFAPGSKGSDLGLGDRWWAPDEGPTGEEPTTQERAALDIAAALRALARLDRRAFEVASRRVADGSGVAGRRRTTEDLLADHLQGAVCLAWETGWQPTDLVRIVSRRLSNRHVDLTRAGIAAQLQRYAPATIDPRWKVELSELEVLVWWSPGQNCVQAWAQAQSSGWPAAVSWALELLDLMACLPELEKLTPVPGAARASGSTARPQRAAIDQRVLTRIRALLAKAESTTFAPEAETFTAGAQSLMARHSIDRALLASLEQRSCEDPDGRRIGIDNPYDGPKAMLLGAVAGANRCRTVWSRDLGFSTVIGFSVDLDAVELLFTSLLVQATASMMQSGSRIDGQGRSRTRSFRQSFLTAYASRIGQRLTETTGIQTSEVAAQPAGRDLLPVLAARSEAVDKAVNAMFPQMTTHRVGSVTHQEGWLSGLSAADQAALHLGRDSLNSAS
jgi:hypothetical protein